MQIDAMEFKKFPKETWMQKLARVREKHFNFQFSKMSGLTFHIEWITFLQSIINWQREGTDHFGL